MRTTTPCFEFTTWGGARRGAGRKPRESRSNVPHAARAELKARHPVHVTWRLAPMPDSLRGRRAFQVVRAALIAAGARFGTRIVHFSVQADHLHLICESESARALSRALKGLGVRLARGLNRLWNRTGAVVADRFHARALKTPREVRNALQYVLQNARHHGYRFEGADPCSSGAWLGADEAPGNDSGRAGRGPLPRARTWLLSIGWRRHGPVRCGS